MMYRTITGEKTDIATRKYASVNITNGKLNGAGVTFWCLSKDGHEATGHVSVYSMNSTKNMYYLAKDYYGNDQRVDGTKTLMISSSGTVDGCAGIWEP